jgi:hypothetical protein
MFETGVWGGGGFYIGKRELPWQGGTAEHLKVLKLLRAFLIHSFENI